MLFGPVHNLGWGWRPSPYGFEVSRSLGWLPVLFPRPLACQVAALTCSATARM
jgi:hypothetical protein